MQLIRSFINQISWPWRPESNREAGDAVVKSFLHHWFPHRVSLRSISWGYSFWLGTVSAALFFILCVTGIILMFFYVPSVERAYWSIKDIEFVISFGTLLRSLHRITAHLMVAVVFLHMFRVFFTNSYKNGSHPASGRRFNWVLGVVLLVLTLLLSFTGYLLPWDQLAYWAITVGTSIASAVPVVGESMREFILGGTMIGQNTLIRFYVLHVFFLPLVAAIAMVWHFWRIRKDGGLAVIERVKEEAIPVEKNDIAGAGSKSYALMGIASGTSVHIVERQKLTTENSVPSSPDMVRRLFIVLFLTFLVSTILSLITHAPLEGLANPSVTPNPAKAPWYFLGLQELVGYSAFVGGVLIPGLAIMGMMLIPWVDRRGGKIGHWPTEKSEKKWMALGGLTGLALTCLAVFIGVNFPARELLGNIFEHQFWFDLLNPATGLQIALIFWFFLARRLTRSTRTASLSLFTAFVVAFIVLTIVGTWLRGPNWDFFWPWQIIPITPVIY
jgi:cytochrome b-561